MTRTFNAKAFPIYTMTIRTHRIANLENEIAKAKTNRNIWCALGCVALLHACVFVCVRICVSTQIEPVNFTVCLLLLSTIDSFFQCVLCALCACVSMSVCARMCSVPYFGFYRIRSKSLRLGIFHHVHSFHLFRFCDIGKRKEFTM